MTRRSDLSQITSKIRFPKRDGALVETGRHGNLLIHPSDRLLCLQKWDSVQSVTVQTMAEQSSFNVDGLKI